ncbi:thyroglobulin-like [Pecten maximus]|uniref:thyroglobulin-like n=1 Tax=Pecten maximus TaxID=6579 RepID=UPI00145863FE|nr:thyroglobulin-like [Pecten maximus]
MKIAVLALVLVIFAFAKASKTPCRNELAAIEAYLAVLAAQNNGVPPVGYDTPECSPDGTYAPLQCKGASCHCKSADGIQISEWFDIGMSDAASCICGRDSHEFMMTQMMGQMFECNETGGYKPVQCTGSVCFCVDHNGQRTGPGSINIAHADQLGCDQFY